MFNCCVTFVWTSYNGLLWVMVPLLLLDELVAILMTPELEVMLIVLVPGIFWSARFSLWATVFGISWCWSGRPMFMFRAARGQGSSWSSQQSRKVLNSSDPVILNVISCSSWQLGVLKAESIRPNLQIPSSWIKLSWSSITEDYIWKQIILRPTNILTR